ncbi:hypothetical protein LXL04_016882 [Taraxacum kok-saghyz]
MEVTDMFKGPTLGISNGIRAVGPEEGMSWKNRFDSGMEEMRQNHAELLKIMAESLKKMDRILEMEGLLTQSERDEAKTPSEENPVVNEGLEVSHSSMIEMHHQNKKKNQPSNMEQKEVNQDLSVSPGPSMAFPSVLPPRNHFSKHGEECIFCQKGRCYRFSRRAPLPPLSQPPASPPSPPMSPLSSLPPSPPFPQQPSACPPLVLNQGELHKKLEKQNLLPPKETNANGGIPVPVKASREKEMTTNQRSKPPPPPPPLSLPETEVNNGGGMNSNSNQVRTQTEVQRRLKGLTTEMHLGQLRNGPNTKTWAKISMLGSLQTDRPMDSVKGLGVAVGCVVALIAPSAKDQLVHSIPQTTTVARSLKFAPTPSLLRINSHLVTRMEFSLNQKQIMHNYFLRLSQNPTQHTGDSSSSLPEFDFTSFIQDKYTKIKFTEAITKQIMKFKLLGDPWLNEFSSWTSGFCGRCYNTGFEHDYNCFLKGLAVTDLSNRLKVVWLYLIDMREAKVRIKVTHEKQLQKYIEVPQQTPKNKDDYTKFDEAFSKNLKMIAGSNDMYCITGKSKWSVESFWVLVKFKKKEFEVLISIVVIKGYAIGQLKELDRKKCVPATHKGRKLKGTEGEQQTQETLKGFSISFLATLMLQLHREILVGYLSFLSLFLNRSTRGTYSSLHLEDKVKVWADGIDKPPNMMVYPRITLKGRIVTNSNVTAIYHLWLCNSVSFVICLIQW